jgi:hypothetical protein
MKLETRIENDTIWLGEHCGVSFIRTLRIPDDGREYPLPAGLGRFPVLKVDDYAHHVPDAWREHGGVFIPMYQREALWLDFSGPHWKPHALKIGIGKVNAVSGEAWNDGLTDDPQDYVVVPGQPWLDGINAGNGFIRQFVAMPLGTGQTVEAQVSGSEDVGGIQLMAVAPKPGRFPDKPPVEPLRESGVLYSMAAPDMGLGVGGRMTQDIYPDDHGLDTWDTENTARVFVHIANSAMYREITGLEPPPTPVDARSYAEAGMPWFELDEDHLGDLPAPDHLATVTSVNNLDGTW